MNKEPVQINFRCAANFVELIEQDIESTGEFKNRTEWIMEAMRQFLDYRTKVILERKTAFNMNAPASSKDSEEGGGGLKDPDQNGGGALSFAEIAYPIFMDKYNEDDYVKEHLAEVFFFSYLG